MIKKGEVVKSLCDAGGTIVHKQCQSCATGIAQHEPCFSQNIVTKDKFTVFYDLISFIKCKSFKQSDKRSFYMINEILNRWLMIKDKSIQTRWAREVLLAHFEKRAPVFPGNKDDLGEKAACFTSLHNPDGSLRGCIGTIMPVRTSLKEEIEENAYSAAFYDPRFSPLKREELSELEITVDVLGKPHPIKSIEELDPVKYGVIVSSGKKRGVLLPDLPGVDRVEQQLAIAMQKAGIQEDSPIYVERFEVLRYH